jgi:hypothetical protein
MVVAPPLIGHRSVDGGELLRRRGTVAHGGGTTEGQRESRGHRGDEELTAELEEVTARLGEPGSAGERW